MEEGVDPFVSRVDHLALCENIADSTDAPGGQSTEQPER